MPVTPFAEYAPDQPPVGGSTRYVLNVLPKTQGSYGPIKALVEQGNSLSATCQGAGAFRGTDGTVVNFAGDATHLYLWDGTAWNDVSRTVGGAYATPTDGRWTFEQFNNTVIASNGVDDPQAWSIAASSNFALLGGSPPVFRYQAVVRDFLMTAHLSTDTQGVRWSEQFNHAAWTIGTNQADEQSLRNNGRITGLVGGQYGLVFQEHAVTMATYIGPDLIFQFDQVAEDRGCLAPGSISSLEQTTFFLDGDGFYRCDGGQSFSRIGHQRVDDTFWADVNQAYLHKITSAIDRKTKNYYVAYPSGSSSGSPDKILVYNFGIDRWALLDFGVDVMFNMFASLGYTLDTLDTIYPDIDLMPISPDSELLLGTPIRKLAAFKSNGKLAFFDGDNMAAVIDSIEANIGGFAQSEIDRIIPFIDGGTISALLGKRDRLNDSMTFSASSSQDQYGDIYFREPPGRFQRARISIASGGTWSHAQGIQFEARAAGDR